MTREWSYSARYVTLTVTATVLEHLSTDEILMTKKERQFDELLMANGRALYPRYFTSDIAGVPGALPVGVHGIDNIRRYDIRIVCYFAPLFFNLLTLKFFLYIGYFRDVNFWMRLSKILTEYSG